MRKIENGVSSFGNEFAALRSGDEGTRAALDMITDRIERLSGQMSANAAYLSDLTQGTKSLGAIEENTAQIRSQLAASSSLITRPTYENTRFAQLPIRRPWRGSELRSRLVSSCDCRRLRSYSQLSWPSIAFHYNRSSDHHPSCHLYRSSEKSWTLGIWVMLPRVLAHAVKVSITARAAAHRYGLFRTWRLQGLWKGTRHLLLHCFREKG